MNPIVTIATCVILVVSWSNPYPTPYAGEIQGVVVVDGQLHFLTLRSNKDDLAIWTMDMKPEYREVQYGEVTVMANPPGVAIDNLPIKVICNHLYMPLIIRK